MPGVCKVGLWWRDFFQEEEKINRISVESRVRKDRESRLTRHLQTSKTHTNVSNWSFVINVVLDFYYPVEGALAAVVHLSSSVSSAYLGLKKGYLFMYNLVQFLGFSWIFVNMTVRLFILGQGLFKKLTTGQSMR